MEQAIVQRAGLAFRAVEAGGLRGMRPAAMLRSMIALARGAVQAWRILREFRPDVVLATGGYACAPVVAAAWLQRCPVFIYLPDIEPGLAVKVLSHLARRVGVSFADTLACFPTGKAVVTGYPVRSELYSRDKSTARARLSLLDDLPIVLVLGGSRGAHSINAALSHDLGRWLTMAQVVHIAGQQDIDWLMQHRAELPADLQQRYHLHAYLHDEMVDALVAADLAVARAGAATMGEFTAVGVPSVLVPYPFAGQHQHVNADFLVRHQAAVQLKDEELATGALTQTVLDLLEDAPRRRDMSSNARALASPNAARNIVEQLALLSGGA